MKNAFTAVRYGKSYDRVSRLQPASALSPRPSHELAGLKLVFPTAIPFLSGPQQNNLNMYPDSRNVLNISQSIKKISVNARLLDQSSNVHLRVSGQRL